MNYPLINPKVHTPCKKCTFAQYDGITQTGCYINKLSQFDASNVVECYDNEQEFYVINNKICLYYNTATNIDNLDDLYEKITKCIETKCHVIIIHKANYEDLEITLRSLHNQIIKPVLVTVICFDISTNRPQIIELLKQLNFAYWRIETALDPDLTKEDYIDIAYDGTKNITYGFYAVFNSGFQVPTKFISDLNKFVNTDMRAFAMILPNKKGNGMIVPVSIHKVYNGNSHGLYLLTKLEADLCDESLLIPITKLMPSFPKNE